MKKEETKTNKHQSSAHLVHYRLKIRESGPEGIRRTMEEMIRKRDEF